MCLAVCYREKNKTIITNFIQKNAVLPLKTREMTLKTVTWGRRVGETGTLPFGGWVTLESVKNGKYDQYFPKSVKILIDKFQEQDVENRHLWFDVTAGHWLQGLLIQKSNEQRVYIVTITPETPNAIYLRWPRILCD